MRMMSLALAAACLWSPFLSADSAKIPKNAKIAVVAMRDAGWFTVCPVFGKDIVEAPVQRFESGHVIVETRAADPGTRAKVTVVTRPTVQILEFHWDDTIKSTATLPLVSGGRGERGAPVPHIGDALQLRSALRERGFAATESPDDADFVMVVESRLGPAPAGVAVTAGLLRSSDPRNTAGDRIFSDTREELDRRSSEGNRGGAVDSSAPRRPDRNPSVQAFEWQGEWRAWTIAMLVPARVYREHGLDPTALAAGRVWQGMAVAELVTFSGVRSAAPASFDALAEQLRGKGRKYPAGLLVCGISARPTS